MMKIWTSKLCVTAAPLNERVNLPTSFVLVACILQVLPCILQDYIHAEENKLIPLPNLTVLIINTLFSHDIIYVVKN